MFLCVISVIDNNEIKTKGYEVFMYLSVTQNQYIHSENTQKAKHLFLGVFDSIQLLFCTDLKYTYFEL